MIYKRTEEEEKEKRREKETEFMRIELKLYVIKEK
jgi:hypothetical protein